MISSSELETKDKLLYLYSDRGYKVSRICRDLDINERTAYRWKAKIDKGEKNIKEIQEGRGRKPSIISQIGQKTLREVRRVHGAASTRRL